VYTLHKNDGETYEDVLEEVRVNESLFLGDTNGYVVKQSDSLYTYDGTIIPQIYCSKEWDLDEPHKNKRWPGIIVDAKGTAMLVETKIDDGDWTLFGTLALTADYITHNVFVNRSGKKFQYRFRNITGTLMDVRGSTIMSPVVEGAR